MKLLIRDLCKQFDGHPVLNHVSMVLESGYIYCLMAPSGKGKTTLFRILMGLETADSGLIEIDMGAKMQEKAGRGDAENSACQDVVRKEGSRSEKNAVRISAVFQEDRLCEAFSAADNVLMTAVSGTTRQDVCEELKELIPGVDPGRPVYTLSGGQKRRVALCRALMASFDLLILDEPFTGLDEESRKQAALYLQKKSAGKLTLLSTHQEEDIQALNGMRIALP